MMEVKVSELMWYLSASPPLLSEEMMIGSNGSSVPEMVIPNGPPYLCSSTV